MGRRFCGRRGRGHGQGLWAPLHGYRQRRHRQGGFLLSHDRQEGAAGTDDLAGEPPAPHLPGGLRRHFSAPAGGRVPRHRRFWPGLLQQRCPLCPGDSADHRRHGLLRGRRSLSAGDVRQAADDRGERTLSGRTGSGQGGHRTGSVQRGTGRRRGARRPQRHRRLPGKGRSQLPGPHTRTGGQDGPRDGLRSGLPSLGGAPP